MHHSWSKPSSKARPLTVPGCVVHLGQQNISHLNIRNVCARCPLKYLVCFRYCSKYSWYKKRHLKIYLIARFKAPNCIWAMNEQRSIHIFFALPQHFLCSGDSRCGLCHGRYMMFNEKWEMILHDKLLFFIFKISPKQLLFGCLTFFHHRFHSFLFPKSFLNSSQFLDSQLCKHLWSTSTSNFPFYLWASFYHDYLRSCRPRRFQIFSCTSITDMHNPRPGNCLYVSKGRIHQRFLRKCICVDIESPFQVQTFDP